MLRTIKQLQGATIRATDGEIGKVSDFYFDDKEWAVRYVVVDTGNWLVGRRVLIAPAAFGRYDREAQELPVDLTRTQVENAPGIDAERPVSRQYEIDLSTYYGWPAYWPPLSTLAPTVPYTGAGTEVPVDLPDAAASAGGERAGGDPHLASSRDLIGCRLEARDGRIGGVDDLILDDETWRIGYMVVDTGRLLSGKKVVLAPSWVQRVDWDNSAVHVDLDRQSVENSSEFDSATILDQE